jgi:Lrp/AsnC family transcriptional regulator for asnA, asnC and gidA
VIILNENKNKRGPSKRKGTDPIDEKIIEILQEDSRTPATKIALTLHKKERTIRDRIQRLVEREIIKFSVVTLFSTNFCCFLEISGNSGFGETLQYIKSIDNIRFAAINNEENVLYCLVFAKTKDELSEIVGDLYAIDTVSGINVLKFKGVLKILT